MFLWPLLNQQPCKPGEQPCKTVADCQGLQHPDCVGDWTCVKEVSVDTMGRCEWECADIHALDFCNEPSDCESKRDIVLKPDCEEYTWKCERHHCTLKCTSENEDVDSDGISDQEDSCLYDPYNDVDGDGICGDKDNCPWRPNPDQKDTDKDGIGDVCDNCPDTFNPDQDDWDYNGVGDACDTDSRPSVREAIGKIPVGGFAGIQNHSVKLNNLPYGRYRVRISSEGIPLYYKEKFDVTTAIAVVDTQQLKPVYFHTLKYSSHQSWKSAFTIDHKSYSGGHLEIVVRSFAITKSGREYEYPVKIQVWDMNQAFGLGNTTGGIYNYVHILDPRASVEVVNYHSKWGRVLQGVVLHNRRVSTRPVNELIKPEFVCPVWIDLGLDALGDSEYRVSFDAVYRSGISPSWYPFVRFFDPDRGERGHKRYLFSIFRKFMDDKVVHTIIKAKNTGFIPEGIEICVKGQVDMYIDNIEVIK